MGYDARLVIRLTSDETCIIRRITLTAQKRGPHLRAPYCS